MRVIHFSEQSAAYNNAEILSIEFYRSEYSPTMYENIDIYSSLSIIWSIFSKAEWI